MGGGLSSRTVDQIAQVPMEAAMARTGLAPENLEHVICGHAHIDTDPYNLARTAWLLTKLDENTPAFSVHACGASGLLALQKAYYLHQTGNDLTALVGGSESYSRAPYILREARYQMDLQQYPIVDSITEGETWTQPTPMDPRDLAAKLAAEKGYTAEQLQAEIDADAAKVDLSLWDGHIVPATWLDRKKRPVTVEADELAPAKDGFISYVDGAAIMMTAEADRAEELGLKPIGRILGFANAAVAPDNRWEGAVKAVAKLVARKGIDAASITDVEILSDSPASQLAIKEGLAQQGFNAAAINPNGSSLAYGVNEGADGVIAAERCLLQLRKTGAKYGIVASAFGGGQGLAMLIEAL